MDLFFTDSERDKIIPIYLICDCSINHTEILKFIGKSREERKLFEKKHSPIVSYSNRSTIAGHFIATFELDKNLFENCICQSSSSSSSSNVKILRVITINKSNQFFEGRLILLNDKGISLVSDIDDTIKISHVYDKRILLEYTLARIFEPVPQMAQLYNYWNQKWTNQFNYSIGFHYISGSPWQMHSVLSRFVFDGDQIADPSIELENQQSRFNPSFPFGSLHLRLIDWKDLQALTKLISGVGTSKFIHLIPLFENFPNRKFVLVGDSGEHDPEVYAQISNKYPTQVKYVFIRHIQSAYNLEQKNNQTERMQKLFANCSNVTWKLFLNPNELKDIEIF
eukprot:TRINITY_DN7671_c0_g2_i1.p1 TRINITY_DN7671_c0_g2~~TRINITY_DN7671_c0_g2_i1.p1  ORF type:complete len:392 (-),score=176.42 TRINITY_DN7671_c0_g2_i1:83-1096(-)